MTGRALRSTAARAPIPRRGNRRAPYAGRTADRLRARARSWWRGPTRRLSLRTRLVTGAGSIALVSLSAAALVVYGAWETTERLDEATAAQARMETLGTLSARINDYAFVAVEAAPADAAARRERVASQAAVVRDAFEAAGAGLTEAVEEARDKPQSEQIARASRSLGLARMRAEFEWLHGRLTAEDFAYTPERLRAELGAFGTRFSPLLDRQIVEERQARDQAFGAVGALADRLVWLAAALALAALAALALFHTGLVRPLLDRLGRFGPAARAIGGGRTSVRVDVGRRDELGLVAMQINRMAARLDRRAGTVAADRRALERTIAERTEELRRVNSRLESIDTSRRRFFADVGHELRTPLTVIRAEAELAAGDASLGPAVRRSFEVIRARAVRLHRRVDDLLRIARSESGEIQLDERPFDLAVSIREAVEDARVPAERRRVVLTVGEEPPEPAVVTGDADWTRQVLSGLIDNAIRHSPEGGRIHVDCAVDGATASALVTDEGSGVPAAERPHLFERFRRGAGAAAEPGFGIGLALARWVVERQHGSIDCESPAPGPFGGSDSAAGARFRVTLPREPAP